MDNLDIRWKQRLENYSKALKQLTRFIERGELNEFEEQGLIQSFEYTYELAWNTLKDFLTARGNSDKLYGSRDATRAAFAAELIADGEAWMKMIEHRNETSHTYNDDVAGKIMAAVQTLYVPAFEAFHRRFLELEKEEA